MPSVARPRSCADGDGELDVILLAEHIQPVQKQLRILVHFPTHGLAQVINENVGNIVVTGTQAADEAAEHLVAVSL